MNVRFLACQTRKAICNVSLPRLWTQEQTFVFTVRSPRGVLGISSDGDDRMEPKVKTQKNR